MLAEEFSFPVKGLRAKGVKENKISSWVLADQVQLVDCQINTRVVNEELIHTSAAKPK
jgi:hypothetical protein